MELFYLEKVKTESITKNSKNWKKWNKNYQRCSKAIKVWYVKTNSLSTVI